MDKISSTLLHLSLIEGVGASAIQKIIDSLGDQQLASVYDFSSEQLARRFGFTLFYAQKICTGLADSLLLEQEIQLIEKHGISLITILDDSYPDFLKTIYLPPSILYVRGEMAALQSDAVAIVGSRKADGYGQRVVNLFVPELVAAGLVIVSGGAAGADSFAHSSALAAGGVTVAVLGSGLLRLYPASNKLLFEDIVAKGGALVSPFSLRADPLPGNFPARNRIIAGLSKGCLVVQADVKSGAAITARFALEQGREVFAVPGSVENPLSAGCHQLIKDGATIVMSAADMLQQIMPEYTPVSDQKAKSVFADNEKRREVSPTPAILFFNPIHQKIYEICQKPCLLDELIEIINLPMTELQGHLFDLQVQGFLEQDFIGRWQQILK